MGAGDESAVEGKARDKRFGFGGVSNNAARYNSCSAQCKAFTHNDSRSPSAVLGEALDAPKAAEATLSRSCPPSVPL